jgi:hypothetical protein
MPVEGSNRDWAAESCGHTPLVADFHRSHAHDLNSGTATDRVTMCRNCLNNAIREAEGDGLTIGADTLGPHYWVNDPTFAVTQKP